MLPRACAHQHPCHAQQAELLLPCTEPSSEPAEVEILGREEGRCGHAREDHVAVEGMEFKSYMYSCLVLHNFYGWIVELGYFQAFLLL